MFVHVPFVFKTAGRLVMLDAQMYAPVELRWILTGCIKCSARGPSPRYYSTLFAICQTCLDEPDAFQDVLMHLNVTERLTQANNNFPLPAVLCTCMLIETTMEQWFINLEPVCGSGQAFCLQLKVKPRRMPTMSLISCLCIGLTLSDDATMRRALIAVVSRKS